MCVYGVLRGREGRKTVRVQGRLGKKIVSSGHDSLAHELTALVVACTRRDQNQAS